MIRMSKKFLSGLVLIIIFSNPIMHQIRAEYIYYSTELKEGIVLEWERTVIKDDKEEQKLKVEITIIQDVPNDYPLNYDNYKEYFNITFDGEEEPVTYYLQDYIWPILYENNSIICTITEKYPEINESNNRVTHTKHTIFIMSVWTNDLGTFTKEYTLDIQTGIVKLYVYTINSSNSIWEIKHEFKGGIKLAGYNPNTLGFLLVCFLFSYLIISRKIRKTNLPKIEINKE